MVKHDWGGYWVINYNVIQQQKINREKLLKNKTDKNLHEKINKLFLADNFEEVKNVVENELFFEKLYSETYKIFIRMKKIDDVVEKFYKQFVVSAEEGFEMTCLRVSTRA